MNITNNNKNKADLAEQNEALEDLLKERANRQQKAEWAQELADLKKNIITEKKSVVRPLYKKIMGAAAVTLFLLATYMVNNNSLSPSTLASNHLDLIKPILMSNLETRGQQNRESEELKASEQTRVVEENLEKSLFQNVIIIYENSDLPKSAMDNYYLANAYIKSIKPNYQLALKTLDHLSNEEGLYQFEALWMKALCHIALEENTQAKLELENLRSLTSFKTNEIQELLEAME